MKDIIDLFSEQTTPIKSTEENPKKIISKNVGPLLVEEMQISDLLEYEHNAKLHPPEQIAQIAKSIKEFGFNDPIAIDENNVIIEGHGRLYALQRLKYTTVPVIRLTHLSEAQKRAYILAHNQLTMNTGFDVEKLKYEIDAIGEVGLDMSEFGFDTEAIVEKEAVDDDFNPEFPDVPKAKLGDVYQLGRHRLVCGDATNEDDLVLLMDGVRADLVITDPPYNVNYGNKANSMHKYGAEFNERKILNDYMPEYNFIEFLDNAFKNMAVSMKPGAAFYVWHASVTIYEFETALRLNQLKSRQQLIWNKSSLVLGRSDYQWKHEPCLYGWKDGAAHYFSDSRTNTTVFDDNHKDFKKMSKNELVEILNEVFADKVSTTVIDCEKPVRSVEHPTMKPLPLLGTQIKNSSKENDIILDMFGGSGSTLIAAEQLDRTCYMLELDPRFIDVTIDRWESWTGQKALKLN